MNSPVDWPALLEPVALALLGEPSKRLRHGAEWRYRGKGSLAVHVGGQRRGTWRDHEAGVGGGVLALVEHIEGVGRAESLQWLRDHGLLDGDTATPPPPRRPQSSPAPDRNTVEYARQLWDAAVPVPSDPAHPARRWMARRHLWRAAVPLPPSIRWLRRDRGPSVGVVMAAFRPPGARHLSGVQLVHVGADGLPALDKDGADGLNKRSYGSMVGAVCVVGLPAEALTVCEGLADALALGARLYEAAAFTAGTSGFQNPDLARWLAGFEIEVWPDAVAKDKGAGLKAARELAGRIANLGGRALIRNIGAGTDPGDAGAVFAALDVQAFEDLRAAYVREGVPEWEAARLASTEIQPTIPTTATQSSFGPGREH